MKKCIALLLTACFACSLCSCGKVAASSTAASAKADKLSPPTGAADESAAAPVSVDGGIDEQFANADGTISFSVKDDTVAAIPSSMPVLQVRPRVISVAQAQRMAAALFGGAAIYEYYEEQTKTEVAELIASYEYSLTDEALRESYGENATAEQLEPGRRARQELLDYYMNAYEYARDDIEPAECLWSFWPEGHYGVRQWDYAGTDTAYTDSLPYGFGVELKAMATAGGMPYTFRVFNREADDFRCHSVDLYVKAPMSIMDDSYGSWVSSLQLYSEAAPDEAEAAAVLEKIQAIVDKLDIGQWQLSATVRQTSYPLETSAQGEAVSSGSGYFLEISGQPIYAGVPVTKHLWLENMRSPDPSASNYYFESLQIRAACDGRLLSVSYHSPVDIVDSWESAVLPIGMDEVKGLVSSWTLEDVWSFDPADPYHSQHPASKAEVCVSEVDVGLSRVKFDDTDFLLIPTLSMHGWKSIYMTGLDSPERLGSPRAPLKDLLIIDLRDGSVIKVCNPPDY